MRGNPGFDQSPDLINHGDIHRSLSRLRGCLFEAIESGSGRGNRGRTQGNFIQAVRIRISEKTHRGEVGYHIFEVDISKDLPRKFLFKCLRSRLVTNHRRTEGNDFVHAQETTLKAPSRQ
jgi:hypothetical protein